VTSGKVNPAKFLTAKKVLRECLSFSATAAGQYVYDMLRNMPEYWNSLNEQEQAHAIWYIEDRGGIP
jgi:hypothetical protein